MQDRDLYAKLLGLEPPWEVVDVDISMQDRSVQVFVALRAGAPPPCPECRERCPRHDTRTRSWRHLDTMQYKTLLVAEIPRIAVERHADDVKLADDLTVLVVQRTGAAQAPASQG